MKKLLSVWLIIAVQSSACYALQLNFIYSEFSEFAFDLYYNDVRKNPDQAFLDDLADFGAKDAVFLENASADCMLLFPRSPHMAEDSFFCKLAQLNAIDNLDQVLCDIEDLAQRKRLQDKINASYATWQKKGTAKRNLPTIRSHVQKLRYITNKNQKLIDDFIKRIVAFYGTQALPSELTIYLCPEASISTYCNHIFFLEGSSCENAPERILGVVLHEVAHLAYEYQKTSLKKTIDHFFLHYPSQHAYMAYNNFDEALATALGNGILVEELTGSPDMRYNNPYIQGFAEVVYRDVKSYLNKHKEIDQAFLVKSVKHFEKRFPQIVSDLSEILKRYILFIDEAFDHDSVCQLFRQHFPACDIFHDSLHHPIIDENTPRYDSNAPRIFVLSLEQKDNLAALRSSNPYLNKVNKSKLKKLKGNFDFYRDKQRRLYLFFIAANNKELENLIKELNQQKYL